MLKELFAYKIMTELVVMFLIPPFLFPIGGDAFSVQSLLNAIKVLRCQLDCFPYIFFLMCQNYARQVYLEMKIHTPEHGLIL